MTAIFWDEILAAMERPALRERLIITPLLDAQKQLGPGTVDLRLGTEFLEVARRNETVIDPFVNAAAAEDAFVSTSQEDRTYVPLGDSFVLHPNQFVLGATLEFLSVPGDMIGQVLSRSSWGRLGLLVATAVVVQPGFKGVLTLELVNTGDVPIKLRPGLRVAQLQLWTSNAPTSRPYDSGGKYSAPLGPESNRLAWEQPERERLRAISDKMHARRGGA
jgi:dCTP deaminase